MICYERKFINNSDLSSFGAFSYDDTVEFQLVIPRKYGVVGASMHLSGEGIENKLYRKFDFSWLRMEGANDVYSCTLNMNDIGVGLYYYRYELDSDRVQYLGSGKRICELAPAKESCQGMIQLLVFKEKSSSAKWLHGGIMYHIFVDRFKSSGAFKPKDTAVINEDWYNGIPQYASVPGGYVENNMFFGGDLLGVIEKLDYIKSLGVSCIYLSPIFEAYSNHKYDTGDYMSVDSMFGDDETLERLILECKKREIGIIFDGVFNHTGADSIYFNKEDRYDSLGAYQSVESKYYEWYNFKDYPDDYECWWNVKILPRVNSNCQSYKDFILGDAGVIEKWMKKGIAGFRLDVADELSDEFLKTLNVKLKSINPDGVIYGEVWEDASNKIAYSTRKKYFLGNELDSVMNYPLREAIIAYIKYGNSDKFYDTCKMIYSHYPKHNADLLMNVLGTHDTERILTVLGGENGEGYSNKELSRKKMTVQERRKAISMLKLAYTVNATVPGIPCIYYGDEAGMEGYRDPFNRLPFPWGREDKELLDYYKRIGSIRVNEPLFKDGYFEIVECNKDILAFVRFSETRFTAVIVNRGNDKYHIDSQYNLKSYETGRSIRVFNPGCAYILKCDEKFDHGRIEFYK